MSPIKKQGPQTAKFSHVSNQIYHSHILKYIVCFLIVLVLKHQFIWKDITRKGFMKFIILSLMNVTEYINYHFR